MPRTITFVAYDGLQPIDLTGPFEVFAGANAVERELGRPVPYEVSVVSARPGRLSSVSGLVFDVALPLPAGPLDTIVVVGGEGAQTARHDQELLAWLRSGSARARRTCSVCSGAFVLAGAGLLDGRRATTHWSRAAQLAREYPAVEVDPEPLFVQDGPVWTSAGVSAGIDLALALVEADLGAVTAQKVARELVMFVRRTGGQSQFATEVWADPPQRQALSELVRHIHSEPGADLRLPVLAERASMSIRHLQRTFTQEMGEPPSSYIGRVRVEAARRVLELQPLPVAAVARQCGFGTAEAMRRAFQRHLGISPDVYRNRFRPVLLESSQ